MTMTMTRPSLFLFAFLTLLRCRHDRCQAQQPINDVCNAAIELLPSLSSSSSSSSDIVVLEGSTAQATDEEPNLCGNNLASKRGVWYLYQNSSIPDDSTVVVTVSTCNDVTNFDTALTLYQGVCDAALECLKGADNDLECGSSPQDVHTTISWHAAAGTRYYLLVHGSHVNHTGQFGLTVTVQAPLPTAATGGDGDASSGGLAIHSWSSIILGFLSTVAITGNRRHE